MVRPFLLLCIGFSGSMRQTAFHRDGQNKHVRIPWMKSEQGKLVAYITEGSMFYFKKRNAMHKVKLDPKVFVSIRDRYIKALCFYSDRCTQQEYQQMRGMIEKIPDRITFGHGDFHPRNVMLQGSDLVLIDMAEAACAHPIFSLMGFGVFRLLCDVVPEQTVMTLAGMTGEQIRRVWDRFLKAYFETEDTECLKKISTVVLCYSAIRAWKVCVQYSAFPPQLPAYCMEVFHRLYDAGGANLSLLDL